MILEFIRTTIADLAHAVARSELAKENARLRSELDKAQAWVKDLRDKYEYYGRKFREASEERDNLRARLEAAENERDHIRENFANAVKAAERRSPVDRSAAIEETKLTKEGFVEILCKGAQKEAPAEKPAAFVPAETDADPSAELVEKCSIEYVLNSGSTVMWAGLPTCYKQSIGNGVRAIFKAIARDHAAAVKRVGELEARLREVQDRCETNANNWSRCAGERNELEAEQDKLHADLARLSAPCPADGMSDEALGEALVNANKSTVANVSPLRSMGRKARELFGRPAR